MHTKSLPAQFTLIALIVVQASGICLAQEGKRPKYTKETWPADKESIDDAENYRKTYGEFEAAMIDMLFKERINGVCPFEDFLRGHHLPTMKADNKDQLVMGVASKAFGEYLDWLSDRLKDRSLPANKRRAYESASKAYPLAADSDDEYTDKTRLRGTHVYVPLNVDGKPETHRLDVVWITAEDGTVLNGLITRIEGGKELTPDKFDRARMTGISGSAALTSSMIRHKQASRKVTPAKEQKNSPSDSNSSSKPTVVLDKVASGKFGTSGDGGHSDVFSYNPLSEFQSTLIRLKDVDLNGGYSLRVFDRDRNLLAETSTAKNGILACLVTASEASDLIVEASTKFRNTESNYWLHFETIEHQKHIDAALKEFYKDELLDFAKQLAKRDKTLTSILNEKSDHVFSQAAGLLFVELLSDIPNLFPKLDLLSIDTNQIREVTKSKFPQISSALAVDFLDRLLSDVRSVTAMPMPDPAKPFQLIVVNEIQVAERNAARNWDPDGSAPDLYFKAFVNGRMVVESERNFDSVVTNDPSFFAGQEGDKVVISVYDYDPFDNDDLAGVCKFTVGHSDRRDTGSIKRVRLLHDVLLESHELRASYRQITGKDVSDGTYDEALPPKQLQSLREFLLDNRHRLRVSAKKSLLKEQPKLCFAMLSVKGIKANELQRTFDHAFSCLGNEGKLGLAYDVAVLSILREEIKVER